MIVNGNTAWNMVKIETDSGFTGLGEAYWGRGVKDIILGYLRPLLLGEDPLNVEPLYTKMVLSTGGAGSIAGVTVTAISGVEIALWDLAGKILGVPVYILMGGKYRDGVRAYWTSDAKGHPRSGFLPGVRLHDRGQSCWASPPLSSSFYSLKALPIALESLAGPPPGVAYHPPHAPGSLPNYARLREPA